MAKKIISIIICALLCVACCACFLACDSDEEGGGNQTQLHDRTKWFTEEELKAKGLDGLIAPTGLTGDMNTSDSWFNDGYSFSQDCPDEETFFANAQKYFAYFNEHYNGKFGKTRTEKFSIDANTNWYVIEQKTDISDYFDDNPSKLYKFYYVKDDTLSDGYLVKGAVWIFEIRYEFDTSSNGYKFKLFIESADSTHNGVYTNYYKMK